ncbi:MAG: HNH endonuclease [Elusimicrobiota bacterium]
MSKTFLEPNLPTRRYWWVNQNRTYRHEIGGGYMWSPKRTQNNRRIAYYDNMREVAPGDVIFSYRNQVFAAVGSAISWAYDCIIPEEFSNDRDRWDKNGWRVDVRYTKLNSGIAPNKHMAIIGPLLPEKHSPLQASGRGNMNYLFEIGEPLAQVLAGLIGSEARELVQAAQRELVRDTPSTIPTQAPVKEWEDHLQNAILHDANLKPTDKKALVTARIGQGIFKEKIWKIETACRVTGVENPNHLIGSHIKPWRHSNNVERLDGENGLLLTPSIDHLFDKGYISFRENGGLLISPRADRESLAKMGVENEGSAIIKPFTHVQQRHLEFHRDEIFLSRGQ